MFSKVDKSAQDERRLSDDIFLGIMFHSDSFTLRNLRIACRTFYDLSEAYGTSLRLKLLQPYDEYFINLFDLPACEKTPLQAALGIDRRIRLARWISAMALRNGPSCTGDSTQTSQISPKDMFESITIGLAVMWRLSDIARTLISFELGEILPQNALLATATTHLEDVRSLEFQILNAQRRHIRALPAAERLALFFAIGYCVPVMYQAQILEFNKYGEAVEFDHDTRARIYRWYAWFIIRSGPDFIASAWKTETENRRCTKLIADTRSSRHWKQFDNESHTLLNLYDELRESVRHQHFWLGGQSLYIGMDIVLEVEEPDTKHRVLGEWIEKSGVSCEDWEKTPLALGKLYLREPYSWKRDLRQRVRKLWE